MTHCRVSVHYEISVPNRSKAACLAQEKIDCRWPFAFQLPIRLCMRMHRVASLVKGHLEVKLKQSRTKNFPNMKGRSSHEKLNVTFVAQLSSITLGKNVALQFCRWKSAEVKQKSLSANIQIRIKFPSNSWVIEFCQSQESIKWINTHIVR